jgi:hypothetical protein
MGPDYATACYVYCEPTVYSDRDAGGIVYTTTNSGIAEAEPGRIEKEAVYTGAPRYKSPATRREIERPRRLESEYG